MKKSSVDSLPPPNKCAALTHPHVSYDAAKIFISLYWQCQAFASTEKPYFRKYVEEALSVVALVLLVLQNVLFRLAATGHLDKETFVFLVESQTQLSCSIHM